MADQLLDVRIYTFCETEMKIEEAILYVLAERNGGLRTEQIADYQTLNKKVDRMDAIDFL